MNTRKSLIVSAAFAALLVPAVAASAAVEVMAFTPTLGGGTVTKLTVVKYDDLNPADAAGAAALFERINAAASRLCTSNLGGNNALISDEVEKCRIKAVKRAVKDVDSDALAAAVK